MSLNMSWSKWLTITPTYQKNYRQDSIVKNSEFHLWKSYERINPQQKPITFESDTIKWLSLSPHLQLLNDATDLWLEAHVQHPICLGRGIVFKSKWFLSNFQPAVLLAAIQMIFINPDN